MQPEAPVLHDFLRTAGDESAADSPTNVASRTAFTLGVVEDGFAEADVVIERQFKTRPVHQGYIEPHACLVSVAADGRATIWSSSQGQFMVRNATAKMTGARLSDIRAIPAEIGGGFGGKTIVYLNRLPIRCRARPAARENGMTREEVFRATGPTRFIEYDQDRCDARRSHLAAQATFRFQAGASPFARAAASKLRIRPVRHRQRQVVGYGRG